MTSENGDYILTGLPSGPVHDHVRPLRVPDPDPNRGARADTGASRRSEARPGAGRGGDRHRRSADTLTKTAQIATNFSQDLIASLPTSRDLNSILLMAPGVHPTGPAGAFSFGGSVSFENLFLLNGVSINENIRGQAFDTAIEDAIQETTVANGGVSAEFGRFSGGVVNIITKSGGNQFSGSFRESLNNDKWRTLTPFETERLTTTPEPRIDKVVPTYEYAGRAGAARSALVLHVGTPARRVAGPDADRHRALRVPGRAAPLRGQGHVFLNPDHRFQVNYNHHDRSQLNYSFNQRPDDGPAEPGRAGCRSGSMPSPTAAC